MSTKGIMAPERRPAAEPLRPPTKIPTKPPTTRPTKTWHAGQSLIEFALALPIFLLLVFGLVDLGRGFYYYNLLSNMAREGARYAIVDPDNTAAISSTVSSAGIWLDRSGPLVTQVITNGTSNGYSRGSPITVSLTYSMYAITPMIGQFLPQGLGLKASSTMLIEGDYG